jgi:thiosulfate reductase cytochrome b subunit
VDNAATPIKVCATSFACRMLKLTLEFEKCVLKRLQHAEITCPNSVASMWQWWKAFVIIFESKSTSKASNCRRRISNCTWIALSYWYYCCYLIITNWICWNLVSTSCQNSSVRCIPILHKVTSSVNYISTCFKKQTWDFKTWA